MKDDIINYLRRESRFRERKNKDRGIVNLLIERYPSLETIDKKILVDVVRDFNSMDRLWRKILSEPENEYLRGKDYYDKIELSNQYQISLGYAPNSNLPSL